MNDSNQRSVQLLNLLPIKGSKIDIVVELHIGNLSFLAFLSAIFVATLQRSIFAKTI